MCKCLKRKYTRLTSKYAAQGRSLLYLVSVISKVWLGGVGDKSGETGKRSPGHAELVLPQSLWEPSGVKQRKQNTE